MKNPYHKFSILDVWRDDLIQFIEYESGNFMGTDRQFLSKFYDYETYQARLALNEKLKDSAADAQEKQKNEFQLKNSAQMRQSYEISKAIAKNKQ